MTEARRGYVEPASEVAPAGRVAARREAGGPDDGWTPVTSIIGMVLAIALVGMSFTGAVLAERQVAGAYTVAVADDLEPYRAKTLCAAAVSAISDAAAGLDAAEAKAESALGVASGATAFAATADGARLIAALTAALASAQALDRMTPDCTTTGQARAAGANVLAMTNATSDVEAATNALNASIVASGKVYTGENGRLDPATLCPLPFDPKQLLRCDAEAALMKLNVAYRAAWNEDIPVDLSYRTYDEQVKMRVIYGAGAAEPGTSNHGWGTAIDLPDYREGGVGLQWNYGTPKYEWMKANAPAYGWINPSWATQGGKGPHEPWHFEYVAG